MCVTMCNFNIRSKARSKTSQQKDIFSESINGLFTALYCLWQLYNIFWDPYVINTKIATEVVYRTLVHHSIDEQSTFNYLKDQKMDTKIALIKVYFSVKLIMDLI